MRRIAFVLAAVLISATALILSRGEAGAHARYESSTPSRGEILASGPEEVEIVFSQEIQKVSGTYGVQVVRDRGLDVTAGPPAVNDSDRRKLSVPLQTDLQPGRYVVNWQNVSDADGDPAEGAFSFYVNYEPNEVDLQNDAQLAAIGAEDTPAATPSAEPSDATPPASGTPPVASPTPDGATNGSGDEDSAPNVMVWVVVVAIVVAAGGAGAFYVLRGR